MQWWGGGRGNPFIAKDYSCFYSALLGARQSLLGIECVFKNQDLQMFGPKFTKYE